MLYSHYRKSFPINDAGELSWKDIDDQYCIDYALGDGCLPFLSLPDDAPCSRNSDGKFVGMRAGCVYQLSVQEDPARAAAYAAAVQAAAARQAASSTKSPVGVSGNAAVGRITEQLKALKAEDRTGHGSAEFRALLEARDLEDLLFSG